MKDTELELQKVIIRSLHFICKKRDPHSIAFTYKCYSDELSMSGIMQAYNTG